MNRARYGRRRFVNRIFLVLSVSAAAVGIVALVLILWSLLQNGVAGLSWTLFTQDTPAPGSNGGLANAITGSLMMSAIAVAVGTPIGILAGTYLAEYGRHSWVAFFVRFINDILLSARRPSSSVCSSTNCWWHACTISRLGRAWRRWL